MGAKVEIKNKNKFFYYTKNFKKNNKRLLGA